MLVLIWLYPVVLSIFTSLKTTEQIARNPFSLPNPVTFSAYIESWKSWDFNRCF